MCKAVFLGETRYRYVIDHEHVFILPSLFTTRGRFDEEELNIEPPRATTATIMVLQRTFGVVRSALQTKKCVLGANSGVSLRRLLTVTPVASATGNLYAVSKFPEPTLSVHGTDKRFPVRRIYCVGSNYRYAPLSSTLWAPGRVIVLAFLATCYEARITQVPEPHVSPELSVASRLPHGRDTIAIKVESTGDLTRSARKVHKEVESESCVRRSRSMPD